LQERVAELKEENNYLPMKTCFFKVAFDSREFNHLPGATGPALDCPKGILDWRMQILDLRAQSLSGKNACSLNLQSTIINHKLHSDWP
jgi:hypothetical protein